MNAAEPESSATQAWIDCLTTALQRLAGGSDTWIEVLAPDAVRRGRADDAALSGQEGPKVVLAGSFNPLHEGHHGIAEVAAAVTGLPVYFELSLENADKPPLDKAELLRRLAGTGIADRWKTPFAPHGLLLSRLATFAEKAAAFPHAVFAVGIDTWLRIGDPAFYPAGGAGEAIDSIGRNGCRFLVFGRELDGRFLELDDAPGESALRRVLAALSTPVPQAQFREDISSTQLRNEL